MAYHTGAVVYIPVYGITFPADIYKVEGAVVIRGNGDIETLYRGVDIGRRTTHVLEPETGDYFWRPELGLFVVPERCLTEVE